MKRARALKQLRQKRTQQIISARTTKFVRHCLMVVMACLRYARIENIVELARQQGHNNVRVCKSGYA